MKLQFKIQEYQTEAVDSVISVFDGQPNQCSLEYKVDKGSAYIAQKASELDFSDYEEDTGYKNADVVLSEEELLRNIHKIQASENIKQSSDLVKKTRALSVGR